MKHLLSIEDLARPDMETILADAVKLKQERGRHAKLPLAGQTWAMLFSKSSTRTRVSFEVGIRELGGQAIFLPANEIQLGRGEPIKDTARVLGRMVHGAVFRTFAQSDVEEFAHYARIPTINALTDQRASLPNPGGHVHVPGKARLHPGQGRGVHRRRRRQCGHLLDLCRRQGRL